MNVKYKLTDRAISHGSITTFSAVDSDLRIEFDGVKEDLQYVMQYRYCGDSKVNSVEIYEGCCRVPFSHLSDGKLMLTVTALQNGKTVQNWMLDVLYVTTLGDSLQSMMIALPDIDTIIYRLNVAEQAIEVLKSKNLELSIKVEKLEEMLDDPSIIGE